MGILKVVNVELVSTDKRARVPGGVYIEFLSKESVKKGDLFKLKIEKSSYEFEAINIGIEGDNLKITAKEVGYFAHRLDREGVDLRTVLGLSIAPVTDSEEIKNINEQSCWC